MDSSSSLSTEEKSEHFKFDRTERKIMLSVGIIVGLLFDAALFYVIGYRSARNKSSADIQKTPDDVYPEAGEFQERDSNVVETDVYTEDLTDSPQPPMPWLPDQGKYTSKEIQGEYIETNDSVLSDEQDFQDNVGTIDAQDPTAMIQYYNQQPGPPPLVIFKLKYFPVNMCN